MAITELLNQLAYVIPTIIVASCTLTSSVKGIFNIQTDWINHLVSWVISLATAELFVVFNGLSFGLGGWDYAVAGVAGLIVGASSNGIYDWEAIKTLFDNIAAIFGKKTV